MNYIPYGVNIRRTYGNLDDAAADRRKVRYLYLDARRIARERAMVIHPPRKIFSCRRAFYGGLFARRRGRFDEFSDRVFERFWRRDLNVEDPEALGAILDEIGLDAAEFDRYAAAEGRRDLDACFAQADRDQIFGVPTFVVAGEPFWGEDRIGWVIRRLDAMGLRR
jgi:2-hydroxychromene-2-carboxylate isomerase